jgi:hypothetical protein
LLNPCKPRQPMPNIMALGKMPNAAALPLAARNTPLNIPTAPSASAVPDATF